MASEKNLLLKYIFHFYFSSSLCQPEDVCRSMVFQWKTLELISYQIYLNLKKMPQILNFILN